MEEVMLKKAALALFGLVLAMTFMAPPKAVAQVHVGVGIGTPVVVQPAPYVEYDEPYFVAHNWNSGYHDGYYYGHGTRYQRDEHGHRHYDNRFRDGRSARGHHDHDRDRDRDHDRGHDDHYNR
jgi:hypothetical protein